MKHYLLPLASQPEPEAIPPATTATLDALRQEIADLKIEISVERLKAEKARLQKELAALRGVE